MQRRSTEEVHMHSQQYLDIGLSPDRATFRRRMIEFAHRMDFPLVGVVLVTEHGASKTSFDYLGNRPVDFVAGADPQLAVIDPVMSHLRRSDTPCVYDQKFYVEAGVPQLWDAAAPFGYRTGIAVTHRLSAKERLIAGVDRERRLPSDPVQRGVLVEDLQRFASYAADVAHRLIGVDYYSQANPVLSLKEREILQRVLQGDSNWVIARLLGVSENTVKFHLKNIFRRLQVSSRVVAATRAQALGLL
jgi:DNA-binding CsgD family transcriptional regulator